MKPTEALLVKHENLGALLDTAARMDPIPDYLLESIEQAEIEIAQMEQNLESEQS